MRCNVGIGPVWLADQHLVAESVELKMVPGMMRRRIKQKTKQSLPPDKFTLSKGHMLFFTDKLGYLAKRLNEVNDEMRRRNFKPGYPDYIDPDEFGDAHNNDWIPTIEDSQIVRDRIVEKIAAKPDGFWRYRSKPVTNDELIELFDPDLLFYV